MTLIFEGPDNCLKTTMIDFICNELYKNKHFLKIKTNSPPKFTSKIEYFNYNSKLVCDQLNIIKYASLNNINLIFDRSYIGEFVYGPLYRSKFYDETYKEFVKKTETKLLKNITNSIIVIKLIDNIDNLIKRDDKLSQRTEYGLTLYQNEIDLFAQLNLLTKLKIVTFDLIDYYVNDTVIDINRLALDIKNKINEYVQSV
jgi:hypothetical protein